MNSSSLTILAGFVFLFFLGYYLDRKLGSGYVWTFVGIGLAFALIAYEIWKISKRS